MEKLHPEAKLVFFLRFFTFWGIFAFLLSLLAWVVLVCPLCRYYEISTAFLLLFFPISFPMVALYEVMMDSFLGIWPGLVNTIVIGMWPIIAALGAWYWAWRWYNEFGYKITDSGMLIKSGVWYRKEVHIPFHRIQNVSIKRGIVSRALDLAEVIIHTAGDPMVKKGKLLRNPRAEGYLPAVSLEVAEDIRRRLVSKAGQHISVP